MRVAPPRRRKRFAQLGRGIACKSVRRKIFAVEIHRPQRKAVPHRAWRPVRNEESCLRSGSTAGRAAVAAHPSGLAPLGWTDWDFGDRAHVVGLLGAETEQRGDVAYFVELGIVFDVEQFDV